MNFTCPYCGNNSFVISGESERPPLATCGKCARVIPFDRIMMTNTPVPEEDRREQPAPG